MTPLRIVAVAILAAWGLGLWLDGLTATTALFGVAALAGLPWLSRTPRSVPVEPVDIVPPTPPPVVDESVLADGIADPVLVLDGERIVRANRAARARFGEHIDGEDVRVVIRHPALLEMIAGPAATDRAQSMELTGLGRPGTWWEARTTPVPNGGLIVSLVDRTAARAADRTRTDFVANASHELRTPLSAILGFVEALGDEAGADPALRAKFLDVIAREARRMGRLIEDLLSLSRIEAGRHAAPDEPVSLPSLARRVAGELGDGRVELDVDDGLADVAGDEPQLRQLLANLVENGLKYGRPGTPVRVTVGAHDGRLAEVRVGDEGEGVAAEHLPRLTERFYRVDPGRSRKVGGTGLGLAIAKHIVERHRGTLRITSTVGQGTTVIVRLPLVRGGGGLISRPNAVCQPGAVI